MNKKGQYMFVFLFVIIAASIALIWGYNVNNSPINKVANYDAGTKAYTVSNTAFDQAIPRNLTANTVSGNLGSSNLNVFVDPLSSSFPFLSFSYGIATSGIDLVYSLGFPAEVNLILGLIIFVLISLGIVLLIRGVLPR